MTEQIGGQNNPWRSMETAPCDGSTIEGLYPNDEKALVMWSERPICMLGEVNGGFPAGWATPWGGDTDSNLPMDAPDYWRNWND